MSDASHTLGRLLGARRNRRHAAQALAAAAGSIMLLKAAAGEAGPRAFAQDSDDDDSSGRGRGRGRGGDDDRDNSGPGNADDRGDDHDDEHEESEQVSVTGVVPEGAVEIRIVSEDAGAFVPGELTVDLGQTVAFVNAHDDEHTATGSGFDTGEIDRGEVATVTLDTPGTFAYACQFHPEMTGSISVRGADGVVPQTPSAAQEIPAGAAAVRIANLAFDPAEITISTGSAVSWTNDDTAPHTVTSTDGVFDSGIFDPGAGFTWTFNEPGSFAYVCQLHPRMQGTVVVTGEAVDGAAPVAGSQTEDAATQQQAVAPADAAVSIVDFAFEPATLDAPAGTTVTWTNDGQAPHTVTGDFADSSILEPGQTFSHAFAEGGEFSYTCTIHPDMVGDVRVSAGAADEPAQTSVASQAIDGLHGVWLMQLSPDDDAILTAQHALMTFHGDDTVDADFSAAPGGAAAATVLTAGRGEWVAQDAVCGIALVALLNDANGRFAGAVTFDVQGQLDSSGRGLDGTFDFAVASAAGQPVGEGSGSIQGGLIPLEP